VATERPRTPQQADVGTKTRSAGRVPLGESDYLGVAMDIIFKSRRTSIPERFREHAVGKLVKIGKLDQKAIRIDVEVTAERNPRQSSQRERVELTIRSRGPVIRAEAAADDRYTALDMAFAKLEARLRRSCDRRKVRHADRVPTRSPGPAPGAAEPGAGLPDLPASPDGEHPLPGLGALEPPEPWEAAREEPDVDGDESESAHLVPIPMEGDGPLVVREKLHSAAPMTIDQALLEMELVGHDFYLFHDRACGLFSVVYRRRGYDYGVIRLLERPT
jgi:ribosomal subunit interface protein